MHREQVSTHHGDGYQPSVKKLYCLAIVVMKLCDAQAL